MSLPVACVCHCAAQILTMSIPFSHYLQNNQAPSEDETREIKALKAIPLKEISIIDVEIERIEGILTSLKQKRAHIQDCIDDFSTILAPVRRLPLDVLSVIFGHCLATHRNPVMRASEAPILLTRICRDWRSIALSIPRLWSRLYIPTMRKVRPRHYHREALPYVLEGERRMEARTEEVQRWLRLSSACPLSITLMSSRDPISHPPLLDSIIQSSRRWQQLELGCFLSPESDVLTRLLSLTPDDLCMLRELRIHSLYSTTSIHSQAQELQDDPWYHSGLLTAPGLRSIFIADMPQPTLLNAGIPPNWNNLNHLFIHSPIFLVLAHQILTNCCNLAACLLEIAGGWNDFDSIPAVPISLSSSPQVLPHLTFLSLQGERAGCSELFASIKAPSLQILEYQGYFPSEFDEFGLLNFLQNINSLKTFRVDHHLITEPESNVLRYYILIPSVTHLVLGRPRKQNYRHFASDSHYSYLEHAEHLTLITTLRESRHQYSPDSAPTVLFPSLEIFEAYGISGVSDTIFLEFIKARIDATKSNTGVSKLKKILVEFSGSRQTDIIPEALSYAQAAGIDLELALTYYATGKELDVTWSPSFGLSSDDVSWVYPSYDY